MHMKTIEERLLKYYNDLIKHNVIVANGPVTLEWLKRQRIVEGRKELDLRFGSTVVDSVLGEKTFLAKAADMLSEVEDRGSYELLPNIACMLSWECDTMLGSENPIREKYACLDYRIPTPVFEISGNELYLPTLHSVEKDIPIDVLKKIPIFLFNNAVARDSLQAYYFEYLQKSAFLVLQTAFKEIRAEVESTAKQ